MRPRQGKTEAEGGSPARLFSLKHRSRTDRTGGAIAVPSGIIAAFVTSEAAPIPESTLSLLTRARAGDQAALDELFGRYGPRLRRWASGRLPRWARDLAETSDIVQETLLQVFKRIDRFEHRGEGALQAYLRQAVMNRISNELRRANRRPAGLELSPDVPDEAASPLDAAIGAEAVERYEAALQRLPPEDRELIVARVELGLTYSEIATMADRPSANAARMAVMRALAQLAEDMCERPGAAQ
jgi:RNA polymerase sigma-70 factor (ECF subfamily)